MSAASFGAAGFAILRAILSLPEGEYASSADLAKKVLDKVKELVPTDRGFIGLIDRRQDDQYIVVRDKFRLVGAAHGIWDVRPDRFRIGGRELPRSERSFTGHVASIQR